MILCWLALLLIRIIETTTGGTWPGIRRHLDRLQAGTFTGPAGTFRQRTELTKAQTDLLAQLAIPAPRQIIDLQPAPPGCRRPRRPNAPKPRETAPSGVPERCLSSHPQPGTLGQGITRNAG